MMQKSKWYMNSSNRSGCTQRNAQQNQKQLKCLIDIQHGLGTRDALSLIGVTAPFHNLLRSVYILREP
ncbi:hypothetical protein PV326_007279 [Microctonus aethiopoides]|nr:hypothetical protein PV326_007279 [Microctonus aethiopoides]